MSKKIVLARFHCTRLEHWTAGPTWLGQQIPLDSGILPYTHHPQLLLYGPAFMWPQPIGRMQTLSWDTNVIEYRVTQKDPQVKYTFHDPPSHHTVRCVHCLTKPIKAIRQVFKRPSCSPYLWLGGSCSLPVLRGACLKFRYGDHMTLCDFAWLHVTTCYSR
jgi:hypothetical protein